MIQYVYGLSLILAIFNAKFIFAADRLSSTHWVTVGDYYANDDQIKPLSYISHEGGITWQVSATLPPPINDKSNSYLNDVFCNKTGQCTAVGIYTSATALLSYISNDFGNNWCLPGSRPCSDATLPVPPELAARTELTSTICDASNKTANCVAVGDYLAQDKNCPIIYLSKNLGVNWEPAVIPTVPDTFGGKPRAVSCQLNGKCAAAGEYNISVGNTLPLIYLSNDFGETWCLPGSQGCVSAELPQIPEDITSAALTFITCDKNKQTNKCAAVGYAVDETGASHPLSYISEDSGYT